MGLCVAPPRGLGEAGMRGTCSHDWPQAGACGTALAGELRGNRESRHGSRDKGAGRAARTLERASSIPATMADGRGVLGSEGNLSGAFAAWL